MHPKEIRTILESYLVPVPDEAEYKVRRYIDLLDFWGRKMPLTSIKKPEEIVRFHFGESIFALHSAGVANGRLADVGSGAGFPGLALKIFRPQLSLVLIESNRKKCAFLHEAVRVLDVVGIDVVCSDFESSAIENNSLSTVTCRALGRYLNVLDWAKGKLAPSGRVFLWLGGTDCNTVATTGGWNWGKPVLIPNTDNRFILSGCRIP